MQHPRTEMAAAALRMAYGAVLIGLQLTSPVDSFLVTVASSTFSGVSVVLSMVLLSTCSHGERSGWKLRHVAQSQITQLRCAACDAFLHMRMHEPHHVLRQVSNCDGHAPRTHCYFIPASRSPAFCLRGVGVGLREGRTLMTSLMAFSEVMSSS